ncbi:glycoside hydrolase family 43 protein [Sphingopyxis indica]|uniref:Alpha-N-arabinofuranosidase n=1 Tax=Sphingopyxis indica TaxID=436663 RepID=A0A239J8L6_9SPHN|nr:glycoside hydrolase family 43 protein [Sphingopyxis indica]SNT02207.1 alpha-N-arabinofuranosidase [Sphingopyxis indica]
MKTWSVRWALSVAVLAAAPAMAQPEARFEDAHYRAAALPAPAPQGQFRNPVLPGFHPDPSIVRVGADFYLVNSTFAWFPGVPVFHSRDLVNWRLIGHAIDRPAMLDFKGIGTNRGIFAPAISYHDGLFYIVTTCIECGGNFYVTARDPAGPWSDPHWLDFDGIDPSFFFDDDGSAWLVNNGPPEGTPRYEGHRAIWIQRFDAKAGTLTGPRKLLVDGGVHPEDNPIWAEGPHIYKAGGAYYLTAAEGGTADRHSQTIYRAARPDGPYTPGPVNPILTQRDLPPDRPDRVEATGHADLVELPDGRWWGAFLATRPFAGQSTLMGRETFLLPVRWADGWPRFLDPGEAIPPLVERPALPADPPIDRSAWDDAFDAATLSPEWIWLRGADRGGWSKLDGGALVLQARPDPAGSLGQPAFVGRRLRHHDASFETRLRFTPERDGDFAGLLAYMDEAHFLAFGVERIAGQRRIVARRRIAEREDARGEIVASRPLGSGDVALRLTITGGNAALAWRTGDAWQTLAPAIDVEPLASVHAGLFTGLVVGPYALAAAR